jgi:hypothetical protein
MLSVVTADALLAEIAALDPPARTPRAVTIARALGAPELGPLLADLGRREPYCRHLAVELAAASGETDHLVAALRDPYPAVRMRALATPGLPEEAVLAMADGASLAERLRLYARLRRRPGPLADRLLPRVRERWGDAEAARLLAACSAAVVAEALPELAYAVPSWTALVARHGDAVVGHVRQRLTGLAPPARVGWWQRNGALHRVLAEHRPADLLDLYERFLVGLVPAATLGPIGRLLAADPNRVARLLLADSARGVQPGRWRLTRSVRDRLANLSDVDLGALLRATGPAPGTVAAILRRVPPRRREAVFEAAYAGSDLARQVLPDDLLAVLPHGRRHAEARRMLALPAVATDRDNRLRVTAFLPYTEAVAQLRTATRSAEAEERAQAYALLVGCAARTDDPAAVTELLAGLDRIRNEQDPVRSRLLGALADVRPELFTVAAIGHLDGLVRDALDARDCSWTTSNAVVELVFAVLWRAASDEGGEPLLEWALQTIERLSAWQRMPLTVSLNRVLRRGQEHAVLERMRPWLERSLRRNEAWDLLALARSLGRRAWSMPDLQDLLGRATRVTNDSVVSGAVGLWLEPRPGRVEKVLGLVDRDESTITLPAVFAVAVRRSTKLIDRHVLAGKRLRGRFGTGKAWWLPTVDGAVLARWRPDQVRRYAKLVRRGVDDPSLERWRRAALTRVAAALPGHGPGTVADLVADEDVLVAEAALTGLARSDRPDEALAVLLENLDGDRARVAIFAAARCARSVPAGALTELLGRALARAPKVTVRKEAARLLSLMRVPGAVDALVAAWHRDGEHRDVRVAVAASLRSLLSDPRSWTVLDEAVGSERHAAESLLDAVPEQLADRHREPYAALVRRLTRHADVEVVQRAYLGLPAWVPWAPAAAEEIVAGVTDLAPGPTGRHAARCASMPVVWGILPDLLPDLATRLVELSRSDPDAEALRDRPARRRLWHLVTELSRQAEPVRRQPEPVRRMVAVLRSDPSFAPAAAQLAAALLSPGPGFAADVAALADILAPVPTVVSGLKIGRAVALWEPAEVEPGLDALNGRDDAAAGLLAVALTVAAGSRAGWPAGWRERLRDLRRHPSADVRHAALMAVTTSE